MLFTFSNSDLRIFFLSISTITSLARRLAANLPEFVNNVTMNVDTMLQNYRIYSSTTIKNANFEILCKFV
ncbi:hypothetical protein BpHYR1_023322 [Brachionus plicatilis]|uniref:Uncharacterized protein n=1 Tax=Brachionus plicatilis TaxID=10195 RepID=A0A3M7Q3J5_BRAPC|nr:hypothetical protein BpHYR1_023322 [Brachionus plicatilis]